MMMSLVALSVDTMLPALSEIGRDLGVTDNNSSQLIISLFFFGMASGQLLYGPVSDNTGRKQAIYLGYGLFITGCLLSLVATTLPVMLAGRLLQGFGAAGPRIVSVAIVRDQYEGRAMARVMSFVMTVFIIVPIIAPTLGQGMLYLAGWRAIFASFLILALLSLVWFALRQPETLAKEQRIPFSISRIIGTMMTIFCNRSAIGYTVTAGLVFGFFLGYLNSAQQIFQELYALGAAFPYYFAFLALSIGCASLFNARFVLHHTMQSLSKRALISISALSAGFFLLALWNPRTSPTLDPHGIPLRNVFRHRNTLRQPQRPRNGVPRKNRRYRSRSFRLPLNLHLPHSRNRNRSVLQRNRPPSHSRFFHTQPGIPRRYAMGRKII